MFYVAHRLFAHHDRWLGALAADRLAALVGEAQVFLPFCDTDEEKLVAPVKGQRLFELDSARLRATQGMLALLHGPSLDDGVCFEIGFLARLGFPVVGFTSDFQTYATQDDARTHAAEPAGSGMDFPDPLFDVVLAQVIRASVLAAPVSNGPPTTRFTRFASRNLRALDAGLAEAATTLIYLAARETNDEQELAALTAPRTPRAYIEPPATRSPDSADTQIKPSLEAAGWTVHVAQRWQATRDSATRRAMADKDWEALRDSSLVIADISGPETPPGAALVLGAAHAQGATTYGLLESGLGTYAPGREPNRRNLMVQYGLTGIFERYTEILRDLA